MAGQQEARLNLVLTAQDQASEVIRKVVDQVKSAFDSINKAMSESFNMSGLAESASHALAPIGETALTVAQQIEDSFRNAEHALVPIGETALTVAQQMENSFRNAGNVIDAEFTVVSEEIVRDLDLIPEKAETAAQKTESIFQKVAQSIKASMKSLTSEDGLFGIKGQTDTMYAGMAMGAAALPIVGFIKDAVKAYADFDQSVANVNTMLHYHGAQLDHLKQQLLDLSKVVPQGPKELADGLYSVVGAGVDAGHAMDVLKIAAEAAAAGQTSMDTSTRALVTVMDSYGMKASQVKGISDILFAANQAGAMTFRDLAASIGTVAGPAANAGVSFKEVAAATAALTNTGLSAQRATQGLRALIMGIQNPTKGAQKEAKQLGIEWDAAALKAHGLAGMIQLAMQATHGNMTELKQLIPNIAAYTAAVNLGGKGAQAFKNALDTVNQSAGATDKAMQAYKQSAQYNLQQFSKAWEDVKLTFAKDVLPTITSVMKTLEGLMKGFGSLSPGMQKAISLGVLGAGAFLSLGSAMFMTISSIGSVITGMKQLGEALRIGSMIKNGVTAIKQFGGALKEMQIVGRIAPLIARLGTIASGALRAIGVGVRFAMGPWGLLIAAVITGVALIITHWKQIATWVKQVFGINLPTNFKQFQQLASQVWKQVEKIFSEVWDNIKKVVMEAWNYIKPTIMDGIKTVQQYWNQVWPEIKELFAEVWNAIKVILGPAVAWMYITISGAIGTIKGAWKDGWNAIKDALKFTWDLIVGIIKTGWDLISGEFKVALDILTGHWSQAWNDMKNTLHNVWNDIKSTVGNLISDAYNWGSNLVKMLGDGIMGGIHYVENAVSTVASKIKSFLGFHSPTEEGPASDSDKWMPNMMGMFVQGIEAHRPDIQNVVNKVAMDIRSGLSPDGNSTSGKPPLAQQLVSPLDQQINTVRQALNAQNVVERADPFLKASSSTYDRVADHTRNVPTTTSLYDRYAGHGAHHVTVNIQIDGRSKETDRQLLKQMQDHLGQVFRTHIPMRIG